MASAINKKQEEEEKEIIITKKKKQECQICCSIKSKYITCLYCSYLSCNDCNERIILETINKPSCVSCKKEFSNAFFYQNFSKAFITKRYKTHRENILYEKEKYLLPATQPEVERIYRTRKIDEEIRKIDAMIRDLKRKKRNLQYSYWENQANVDREKKEDEKSEEKSGYICPCPTNDCRGFLSNRYKCGLCGIQACSDCREVKENDDHKCDPNILENVKEIKKTTRNCPNCKTLIFRISGCDQMWCTQCNVAFCWRTGKIEKGIVHNPHYFEYMRNNSGAIPRNPHEVRCGGMPDRYFLNDRAFLTPLEPPVRRFNSTYYKVDTLLAAIYRQVIHITAVEIRALPTQTDNITNQDLRIDFLLKNIDENEFKIKLQRREKDRTKKLEYREVLELYTNVLQDLFIELSQTKNYNKLFEEEEKVRKYVDEGIYMINQKYDSKLRDIADIFRHH